MNLHPWRKSILTHMAEMPGSTPSGEKEKEARAPAAAPEKTAKDA